MKLTRRVIPVFAVTALLGLLTVACGASRNLDPDRTTFLTCATQPGTELDRKPIGRPGGQLGDNTNGFVIPGKALGHGASFDFVLSRPASTRVGVVIEGTPAPPGLSREATVFISFAHCTPTQVGDTARWRIARFPNINSPIQSGQPIESGRTGNVLWGFTDHNSAFIIVAD